MIKAIIFDIDGTLIDSNDAHAETWRLAFEKFGKQVSFGEMKRLIGMGGDKILEKYLSAEENEKFGEELEEFRGRLFRDEYLPDIEPFPGVRRLFEQALGDGLQVALATSANEEEIDDYKRIARIEDLVEKETSSDDVEESKPDPDIFRAAFGKLINVEKEETLIIGDTPYDAEAAVKVGIRVIGVETGGWDAETLKKKGCAAVYPDIDSIREDYERIVGGEVGLSARR